MCHITMPKPTVRSMRPAIIGRVAASASRATIDLSARIERALSQVGNVSGKQHREQDDQRQGQEGQAIDRRQAQIASPARERRATSGRVGSSAFDLMDCMRALEAAGRGAKERLGAPNAGRAAASRFSTDRSSAANSGDHPAAIEDQRTVANLRHLLEIRRYDDDRRPACSATSNRR